MRYGPELAAALRPVARCGSSPASASRSTPRPWCGAQEALGLPIHDNWWQTETGAIMISNFAAMDIRPGSMGRPLPGVTAAVLRRGEDGRAQVTGGQVVGHHRAGRRGRARAAARLAVDVPRLPARPRALRAGLRRRLVPDRRRGPPGRRRLLLVRRPGRRRDQVGRPPHRAVRGGERADGAPGGGRGRRDRQARPGRRGDRQGLRRAQAGPGAERGAAPRTGRVRPPHGWARSRRRRSSSTRTCR